jgi:epoxyqueuosine reductase
MKVNLHHLQALADQYTATSPLNRVEALGSLVIFDRPLIAVAAADDPWFERLKDDGIIGSRHLSPREWLDGARSVLSFFLPFTRKVREANRVPGLPAIEWLYGRIEGEQFNRSLSEYLRNHIIESGAQAVSPGLDPRFKVMERRSNWSERHVAFIAGLGTFSLSRSLITRSGSAGRFGSLITDLDLEPTSRSYETYDEWCVKCGACIRRCPPLAITEEGKDNAVCGEFLDRVLARYRPRYGCGKCQTGVPCESRAPG